MGCSRASHFSHVSASRLRWLCSVFRPSQPQMHSRNLEGWHGLAGWRFRRLPETGAGLWADDGGNSLPDAGSSLIAANIRLAELRPVSEIPGAAGFPRLLGAKTRGTALFGPRRAFQTDQAGRTSRRRRRVSVALISASSRIALAVARLSGTTRPRSC